MAGGKDTQLGIAEETTFGTQVTPTRFFEYTQESVKYDRERIEAKGLRVGRKTVDRWVAGRKGVGGDIEFEILPNGSAVWFKHALGAVTTTTPPTGTTARLHTAKVGTIDAKGLTVQIGRPNNAGVVDPYLWFGTKINQWELTMETGNVLMGKMSIDALDEDTTTALAVASYGATNELLSSYDANTSITIGGVTYDVKKATIGGNNNLPLDRYYIGSPVKREPLEASLREYTGTVDLESYKGLTPYNLFKAGTEAAIVYTFSGSIIELALRYFVKVTLPRCRFDGDSPNVQGEGLLDQSIPFKALYSAAATTEVQIETQNTDTAA